MPSRKNVWRRRGRFEFRRETARLSDGTPWGDTLWIRSVAKHRERGRAIAYVSDRKEGRGAELGLGVYHKPESRRDAVACAKQSRAALLTQLATIFPEA